MMEMLFSLVLSEFIFKEASFRSCHASTLTETKDGLLVAWFGGTDEGKKDVEIWTSRLADSGWSAPVSVANGIFEGKRFPCWNPVLFTWPDGEISLFYKVGPNPASWWGMMISSKDAGRTWSAPVRLPQGVLGPIKNKPVLVGDTLLCPSSTEDNGWQVWLETTSDRGRTWKRIGPLNDGREIEAIQPSILKHPGGKLQMLGRTRQGRLFETWSDDGGNNWSKLALTTLPNPNSGTDAVTLADGRHVLAYNPVGNDPGKNGGQRSPLSLALSRDGKAWKTGFVLEKEAGEFSYPAILQTRDGRIHVTYTWKRLRIKHAVLEIGK